MLDVPEVDVENTNEAAAEIPNVEVDTPPAATETPAVEEVKEKLEPGGVILILNSMNRTTLDSRAYICRC